ncbi:MULTISPECIES: hypothetical protein [Pseudoalteromonas]|uniref:Porin n=1 Tax=Pseudoalteromonas fuliginea TaxID=1872678 RepID=A0A063KKT5_9GAMM|nr:MULTISPECIES: hypothetical protein [Pseudoalteromonas]ALQ10406.1 hypothetical protein D172_020270 [Pseudoalteromonas sp. Bsw20308]KAA1150982.1 hypothetical protein EU509_17935 [Pseudoalteromonas fuliginea]KAA1157427.1 hypothetical protein EU508_16995 [Pseudoalteromonas fuliginea]KAA1165655.1 hypothetical protein EUZ79_17925 [Pseudoalteromonas fuliginea]KDC49954.1 hypothetical protein DO88_18405 [Pseudoalteromonas sp. S3431]
MKFKKDHNEKSYILKGISFSAIALSISLASVNVSAGAWVGEEGSGYIKLGYADYTSSKYRGNNPTFERFEGQNTSLYLEHGLGNNFSIYGSLLHQSYEQEDSVTGTSSASGFGDTEVGIRYQWQAEPFVLSTSFLVKTPFLYDEDDGLGNNQEDYEAKILLGKGLDKFGYIGAEVGYRVRTAEPSDEYRYLLEYGFNVNKNIYMRAKLDGILSAENADSSTSINAANLSNPLEFDSGKFELATGWNFDKNSSLAGFGIELTFTREIYGSNILQGNNIQFGITKVY